MGDVVDLKQAPPPPEEEAPCLLFCSNCGCRTFEVYYPQAELVCAQCECSITDPDERQAEWRRKLPPPPDVMFDAKPSSAKVTVFSDLVGRAGKHRVTDAATGSDVCGVAVITRDGAVNTWRDTEVVIQTRATRRWFNRRVRDAANLLRTKG